LIDRSRRGITVNSNFKPTPVSTIRVGDITDNLAFDPNSDQPIIVNIPENQHSFATLQRLQQKGDWHTVILSSRWFTFKSEPEQQKVRTYTFLGRLALVTPGQGATKVEFHKFGDVEMDVVDL
jgi:hypothetical protein